MTWFEGIGVFKVNNPGLSVIIPAYNEEKRIRTVLDMYARCFQAAEIIVVCDGCTDKSIAIVRDAQHQYDNIRLLTFAQKLGKGGGIIKGFREAKGNVIGFVDADNSFNPQEIQNMVICLQKYDACIASRRQKNSKIIRKQPLYRQCASWVFNIFIRVIFLLPYHDTQCGAKFFRRTTLMSIIPLMKTRGFEFDVELLWRLKRNGSTAFEYPVTWGHSEGSTFSMKNIPHMFISLVRLRLTG